jgi:hypothetical protein
MRIRLVAALLAASGTLAACVQRNVVSESPGALEASPAWTTPSGDGTGVRIDGALIPDGDTRTTATIKLTGAQAGATYAWHVHYGSCAGDVGVVGESAAYPPLTIDANGEGTSHTTLPFTTPSRQSGTFFIKVHEAGDMSAVIACQQLNARGVRAANFR